MKNDRKFFHVCKSVADELLEKQEIIHTNLYFQYFEKEYLQTGMEEIKVVTGLLQRLIGEQIFDATNGGLDTGLIKI
jgi:hypothetical protein